MPWAIFKKDFNWSKPKSMLSYSASASPDPQERKQEFIDQAVARGFAEQVDPPTKEEKEALKAKAGEPETVSVRDRAAQIDDAARDRAAVRERAAEQVAAPKVAKATKTE